MSRVLSQKNEKAGGAGLRARRAPGGQGRPPHQFSAFYELFVTVIHGPLAHPKIMKSS